MKWLREAVSDSDGLADAAYVSIIMICIGVLATIGFLCAMSAISYFRCYAITDVGQGVRAQVPCAFDPQPVGIAIGAVCTAFAAAIGALAGYMAATKRSNTRTVTASSESSSTESTTVAKKGKGGRR